MERKQAVGYYSQPTAVRVCVRGLSSISKEAFKSTRGVGGHLLIVIIISEREYPGVVEPKWVRVLYQFVVLLLETTKGAALSEEWMRHPRTHTPTSTGGGSPAANRGREPDRANTHVGHPLARTQLLLLEEYNCLGVQFECSVASCMSRKAEYSGIGPIANK